MLDIRLEHLSDVGAYSGLLKVSFVGCYFYETDTFEGFSSRTAKLWPDLSAPNASSDIT